MTAVLSVEGLTVTSGRTERGSRPRTLVNHVWFAVAEGERVGIIGESGSGKSLTVLAASGLLPSGVSAQGSVELRGTQVLGASDRVLDRLHGPAVAVVFQEPLTALDPLMRVGRQLAEPLRRHHRLRGPALRSAVLDRMAEVALPTPERIARSFPHQLSGGQRQRVAIAMALACDPHLLIADEPTTALDVTVQAEILDLLDRSVRARSMSLLFVSHDIAVVAKVSDRVLVMKSGELVEGNSVTEILNSPCHEYTRELVDGARALETALRTGHLPAPAQRGERP